MIESSKISAQQTANALLAYGVKHVIISPGSRNAPLIIQFNNQPDFTCYSIVDERCAGFVALGLAKHLQKPVAVCCTSGSAAVNYYPAVVEAFYQNIPIVVLSADRPVALIDNFYGQTIRQKNVFSNHLRTNLALEENDEFGENESKLNKSLTFCVEKSEPIHINLPFSEPLYEVQNHNKKKFSVQAYNPKSKPNLDFGLLAKQWNESQKKLILVGMHVPNKRFEQLLSKVAKDDSVVILTESTSNIWDEAFFNKIDSLIFSLNQKEFLDFKPHILLTIGQCVVSKKIKELIRANQPKIHWHLDEFWSANTFLCLSKHFSLNKIEFLENFVPKVSPNQSDYRMIWNQQKIKVHESQDKYLQEIGFSDLKVFEFLNNHLPKDWVLHFANSSPIRYSQLFNFGQEIYCNRGTSGIDGSTSTAIGMAIQENKTHCLITGDISFFYDSNALWNAYIPNNFKIILINNGGGNIFKIIPGPKDSGALNPYFETKHQLTGKQICGMFGFGYFDCKSLEEVHQKFNQFCLGNAQPQLLEVNTKNVKDNHTILQNFFTR